MKPATFHVFMFSSCCWLVESEIKVSYQKLRLFYIIYSAKVEKKVPRTSEHLNISAVSLRLLFIQIFIHSRLRVGSCFLTSKMFISYRYNQGFLFHITLIQGKVISLSDIEPNKDLLYRRRAVNGQQLKAHFFRPYFERMCPNGVVPFHT